MIHNITLFWKSFRGQIILRRYWMQWYRIPRRSLKIFCQLWIINERRSLVNLWCQKPHWVRFIHCLVLKIDYIFHNFKYQKLNWDGTWMFSTDLDTFLDTGCNKDQLEKHKSRWHQLYPEGTKPQFRKNSFFDNLMSYGNQEIVEKLYAKTYCNYWKHLYFIFNFDGPHGGQLLTCWALT